MLIPSCCRFIHLQEVTHMSEYRFYWWRSCGQCKDAKHALDSLGIDLNVRDFFKDPLTRDELQDLGGRIAVGEIFSWRSPSSVPYRERRGEMTDDEMIDAMLVEPRLIRRPILVPPSGDPIVGFGKQSYASLS